MAESVGTRRDVVWLALKDIVPTPTAQNSRRHYEPATIRELTQSIRQHGLLQPLCVRPSGAHYVLIFGLRRYQAAIAAGLSEVPCTILPTDDGQALLINLTENLQREQLRGSERLRAIEHLAASGLGVRELSRRTGFAPSTISRWLRIDRDPALRAAVESGALDIGQAKLLVDAPKPALPALLQEAPRLTTAELRDRVAMRRRLHEVEPMSTAESRDERHLREALANLRAVHGHIPNEHLLAQLHAEMERIFAL